MSQNEKPRKITEDELAAASGGGFWEDLPQSWDKDPPPRNWERGSWYGSKPVYIPAPCPSCGAEAGGQYSMYASYSTEDIFSRATLYRIVVCFACRQEFREIDSDGNVTIP